MAGMARCLARCAVPARVQRAERMRDDMRITGLYCATERGADGAARQRYPAPPSK
jgi:hypothetical protein